MFRLLFKDTNVNIKKTEKVFVKEENYLKDLVQLLEYTPKRILSMYIKNFHIILSVLIIRLLYLQ